jgi:hypothetical protein
MSGFGLHPDLASMALHNFLADGEPDTSAGKLFERHPHQQRHRYAEDCGAVAQWRRASGEVLERLHAVSFGHAAHGAVNMARLNLGEFRVCNGSPAFSIGAKALVSCPDIQNLYNQIPCPEFQPISFGHYQAGIIRLIYLTPNSYFQTNLFLCAQWQLNDREPEFASGANYR